MQSPTLLKNLNDLKITPNLTEYVSQSQPQWDSLAKDIPSFSEGIKHITYHCLDFHLMQSTKDKEALLFWNKEDMKESYTYADLATLSNKFAHVLSTQEVVKGDRVCIFLPTIPERLVTFLGTLRTGAIVLPLFAAFQEMALLDRLKDSEAKVVVTTHELYPRIHKIMHNLPHLKKIIIIQRGSFEMPTGDQIVSYNEYMAEAPDVYISPEILPTDPAFMLYTSGTTGKPKGIIHTHKDVIGAAVTSKYVLDLHEDDIYWCTADLGWVTGVVYGVIGPLTLGVTTVGYEGRFSATNWYSVLEKSNVSVWYTAPTAIRMLMGSETTPSDYHFPALRLLASVGEPLNPEGIWWGLEKFGLPFHDTWWQTELGCICITNFASMDIKPGSMGKPFPGIKAAILDDDGEVLPTGQEGMLALDKTTIQPLMDAIWKNSEKYQSYFHNNWYLSGDRAYQDEDGYFWFVGRADDIINTSGERVGPFEVESALVAHPDVVEAGVIGYPDELRGEIVMACVVLKPNITPSDELIKDIEIFVKQHLSGYAYPRKIVFVDKLPKTRSGKIMRRVLKARVLGLPEGDTSTLEEY